MNFPHTYKIDATATPQGSVKLTGEGLPAIESESPAQFGGPGDKWSPEDMLTAAVADCFVLSFRAIAAASKFAFVELKVHVEGTLDRVEREMLFTQFSIQANLTIPTDADAARAQRLLEKAETTCLITNSLKSTVHLTTHIQSA
jgi:peroxiredoxin-like protein